MAAIRAAEISVPRPFSYAKKTQRLNDDVLTSQLGPPLSPGILDTYSSLSNKDTLSTTSKLVIGPKISKKGEPDDSPSL